MVPIHNQVLGVAMEPMHTILIQAIAGEVVEVVEVGIEVHILLEDFGVVEEAEVVLCGIVPLY